MWNKETYVEHLLNSRMNTFFYKSKLYKNNEAETCKKQEQIKNFSRLGNSKTKQ